MDTAACMTQSLIVMRVVVAQSGTRDQIIVNRIVANLTGIAMAVIVAFLPPQVYGSDPKHADALYRCERDAMSECWELLLDMNNETSFRLEQILANFNKDIYAHQKEAVFLLKDASKMSRLPIFKVDARLGPCVESLTVLGTAISSFLSFAIQLAHDDTLMMESERRRWFRKTLSIMDASSKGETEKDSSITATSPEDLEDFIAEGRLIDDRLNHYAVALAEIHRSVC